MTETLNTPTHGRQEMIDTLFGAIDVRAFIKRTAGNIEAEHAARVDVALKDNPRGAAQAKAVLAGMMKDIVDKQTNDAVGGMGEALGELLAGEDLDNLAEFARNHPETFLNAFRMGMVTFQTVDEMFREILVDRLGR